MELNNPNILEVNLTEIATSQRYSHLHASISYSDGDLIVMDNLREMGELLASRVTFNIVGAITSGKIHFKVAGASHTIQAGQVFICHSHTLLSDFMVSPDYECRCVFISDRLQNTILEGQALFWKRMVYSRKCLVLEAGTDNFGVYDELRRHWAHTDKLFHMEIIVSLLRVLYLELCELLMSAHEQDAKNSDTDNVSRMEQLFHRFLENVARRHIKKRSVAEYAEELCITPKYLSTICRTMSGKSPTDWISEYLVQDIQGYLRHTDLSTKEIAEELGFTNVSFFCKYVREHIGVPPYEYRNNYING